MSGKQEFPHIHNSGEAIIQDDQVTFTWITSLGKGLTETMRVLSAKKIAKMVVARMERFKSAGPGSRESEMSRQERKYISAHLEPALKEAWGLLDEHGKMEMDMMLNASSHHGISDPQWVQSHTLHRSEVVGDDKRALDG
jgi:hypothetical protein